MSVRTVFPFRVRTEDPIWIPLADGTRLAATLWRPATDEAVPVVVEMIPYRRRDGTVTRDLLMHPWLAGHGVACCRIDLRGAGDSDGILADEYLPREQQDACDAIAWLAAQSWCNGCVGMTGISWGGFNALQVTARKPPALKAIITLCSTDDRYADDVHYMGGALLTENEMWSNFMLAKNALPPDPQIVGDRWRVMWERRLEENRSWSEHWLAHQRRDAYWKQGSVCEDFSAIDCPVLAVCGWDDSYSNATFRLLERLKGPRKAIMGPWTHAYPFRGEPGPAIGYLQEALRWWRQWLKGEDTGVLQEPDLRVWITGEEPPRPWYGEHAGWWVAEDVWPSPRIERRVLHLLAGNSPSPGLPATLSPQTGRGAGGEGQDVALSVRSPATAGTDCGRWGGYGGESPDMPLDQRREDALALCFDTEPLEEELVLLGAPELDFEVSVDQPLANLAVRLCDVWPDGTSALMTYGVLNLTHRLSHEHPEPCPVGTPFRVRLKLNDLGRIVPKGHRIRLALSNQHWPILWPQPKLVTLIVKPGSSTLALPIRPPSESDGRVRFEPKETSAPVLMTELEPGKLGRTVSDDVGSGVRSITLLTDFGAARFDDRGIEVRQWNRDRFEIHPDDPLSARLHTEYVWAFRSGEADVESRAVTELSADAEDFLLSWRLEVREKGRMVHSTGTTRRIPRDFC
ncbi:MAG: CocE/NonD family hydrolase [Parvibaculaceae bacterium]